MSKAEERANEKYPIMQENDKEGLEALKYIGMECDDVHEYNNIRYSQQAYFIEGYKQAEKDLKLTVGDIAHIHNLANTYCKFHLEEQKSSVYKEILRLFNEQRNKGI